MNVVSPGPVDTPILKDFIATLEARAEEDMNTMDRPGKPGDIAPVVAFLLSDGSAWLRGTNVPVDGGSCVGCTAFDSIGRGAKCQSTGVAMEAESLTLLMPMF